MGQKQVPTSPPPCGAGPVTLLATTPQDRLTVIQSEGRVTGPRTEAPGSSLREFSGCKPVCSPTQEPCDGHPERGPDGSSLSSPRKCRRKPQAGPTVRTPRVRGCSAAGRASSPTMRPWPAAEAAAHPPLLPPHHPEPGLRTFPNKYAFQVSNYLN